MKNLFKGQTVSLVACGLLLSSSMAFGADTIDAAFKEGKVSGALTAYNASGDLKDGGRNYSYTSGAVSVGYETGSIMGVSGKVAFIGAHVFDEAYNGDSSDIARTSLMTESYIKYANDMFSVTAGRQAVDLEWMGDYHEAVVAAITAVPDTTIVLGYTNRMAVAGVDEISDTFSGDWNGDGIKDDGAYVADIKYTGLKGLEFNPYAYAVPSISNWYGLKTTFTTDYFGGLVHYAASNEDAVGTSDGSMLALELNTKVADISAAVGYIQTDKDGGIGSMAAVGDNYEPLDSGNAIYRADAKMIYGSLGYTIVGVDLGAIYGVTTFDTADYKEKELNLTAAYSFTDSFSANILFANIDVDEVYEATVAPASDKAYDQSYVLTTVEYTF